MNSSEQLGAQLRAAREAARFTLRSLSSEVGISASTIGAYERGAKVPEADKLAKIAFATNHFTFQIDDFTFTVGLPVDKTNVGEQLRLDFSAEYNYARALVKIEPGKITVAFDGAAARRLRPPLQSKGK
jgi:transcriptional regulator with XRE-family HTH domain